MYDIIIIGLGSMGSSTLYNLAKRGVKVLGLEQFGLGHGEGSHSGQTRIVRKAYFEHPDYVPLLEEAYKGWKEIEERTGKQLYHQTGLAYFGESDNEVMKGVKFAAEKYNIQCLTLNKEYSVFNIPGHFESLIEPEAGFALTEQTIKAFVQEAKHLGAEIRTGEKVLHWSSFKDGVVVTTSRAEYRAKKLIITSGAYVRQLVPSLKNTMKITRQLLAWVKPGDPGLFELGSFPCWMLTDPEYKGLFYGFPSLPVDRFGGNGLIKVGHHIPGDEIDPEELHEYDPRLESEKLMTILKKYIQEAAGSIESVTACMYTNTPDENFVLDRLPDQHERVVIGTGFSGHGFKFVPVVGKILSDLAISGNTELPARFLSLSRLR